MTLSQNLRFVNDSTCRSWHDGCNLCDSETDSAMMRLNIAIDYLANCPGLVDELARLSWKEWQEVYEQRKQTLEDSLKNYRDRMNTDRLPLTFVALHAGKLDLKLARRPTLSSRALAILPSMSPVPPAPFPSELVGMVSLKFHDMDTRPDLDPWLGGLLVLPEWRNRGVGTMLMHRATEEARRLNISRLYLWTHSAEGLYHKLGWQVVERTNYFGKEAVVMQIDFRRQ
jgi:GNAT superfamily N-acetyltransferase